MIRRGPKNHVDPWRPYHMLVETERSFTGDLESVATVFLTGRECPFTCLMCDLWKNTLDGPSPPGAIAHQIRYALDRLAPAEHIKLYNSGNFFDDQAIPPDQRAEIAGIVGGFKSVIVENHPKLVGPACVEFQSLCQTQLEVAMGLETSHEPTLRRLGKTMTSDDFARAADFLKRNQIRVRCFLLLQPPGVVPSAALDQAIGSVRFAIDSGADAICIIPTRVGNAWLEHLQRQGRFMPPSLHALETAHDQAMGIVGNESSVRVWVDLWDVERLQACPECAAQRIERMRAMNLSQRLLPRAECPWCDQIPH